MVIDPYDIRSWRRSIEAEVDSMACIPLAEMPSEVRTALTAAHRSLLEGVLMLEAAEARAERLLVD